MALLTRGCCVLIVGQQLTAKVKDVMSSPAITLTADKTVSGMFNFKARVMENIMYHGISILDWGIFGICTEKHAFPHALSSFQRGTHHDMTEK